MILHNVTIKSTGSYLPKTVLSNKTIESNTNTTDLWMQEKLGIFERRISNDKETVSFMGAQAAKNALKKANLTEDDIDLIVVATSSPEKISPSIACTIHKELGFSKNIPCYDINAVCSGFLFAMSTTAPLVSIGMYRNVLIIATESYSRITDWKHRNCVFFGDGAGAAVIGGSKNGFIATKIHSNSTKTGMTGFECLLNQKYTTNPKQVWDAAVSLLPSSITEIIKKCDLEIEDISMFFPHQASINMLKQIAREVGLNEEKIKFVMNKYANIAGASIPIALDEAFEEQQIKKGDNLLLTAIGSGWSWGSIVVRYE